MISFWLTSVLLSVVGYTFYRLWVKEKASFWQQKGFIYLLVLGSLGFPAIWGSYQLTQPETVREVPSVGMFGQIDKQALSQHCRCENPNYTHRFHYRANALLNTAIYYQDWLVKTLFLAIGLVGLMFLGQMIFLARLIRRSKAIVKQSEGRSLTFLYPSKSIGAGAFWLGKPYIIWQDHLDSLLPSEREAVLEHELSHIRQGNTFEQFLLRILHCFWVLNPVFYLLKRDLALLSECIADQAATDTRISQVAYARLLIALKQPKGPAQVASFSKSMLRVRIERLFSEWPKLKIQSYLFILACLVCTQFVLTPTLLAGVGHSVTRFKTYVSIHEQLAPSVQDAYFCVDCNSMCQPGDYTSYPNPTLVLPTDSLSPIQN